MPRRPSFLRGPVFPSRGKHANFPGRALRLPHSRQPLDVPIRSTNRRIGRADFVRADIRKIRNLSTGAVQRSRVFNKKGQQEARELGQNDRDGIAWPRFEPLERLSPFKRLMKTVEKIRRCFSWRTRKMSGTRAPDATGGQTRRRAQNAGLLRRLTRSSPDRGLREISGNGEKSRGERRRRAGTDWARRTSRH